MKYGDLTLGQVEAIVNKLGGIDGVGRFLRDELVVAEPTRSWSEQDGVITFSVTSDGTTGVEWIKRLEGKNLRSSDYAKRVLVHEDFKPTKGVTTEIVVLKGMLWNDNDRVTTNIRAEADRRKLVKPNPEVACLIREKFTDSEIEAMGLVWIIAMHDTIEIGGVPDLLGAPRHDAGRWLHACRGRPGRRWVRDGGFAFAASQVSS
ncbi:MAG: hypothetical protein WC654_03840 [Patescibacteria group bacterium]